MRSFCITCTPLFWNNAEFNQAAFIKSRGAKSRAPERMPAGGVSLTAARLQATVATEEGVASFGGLKNTPNSLDAIDQNSENSSNQGRKTTMSAFSDSMQGKGLWDRYALSPPQPSCQCDPSCRANFGLCDRALRASLSFRRHAGISSRLTSVGRKLAPKTPRL